MRDLMIEELEAGKRIVAGGDEIIPGWTILTPDGAFGILTRFDPAKPEQREYLLALIPRFIAWKSATSFMLRTETWLGLEGDHSEEAVLVVGISRVERIGVIARIHRKPELRFDPPQWVPEPYLDPIYGKLLPTGTSTVTAEEVAELALIFSDTGELPARLLN